MSVERSEIVSTRLPAPEAGLFRAVVYHMDMDTTVAEELRHAALAAAMDYAKRNGGIEQIMADNAARRDEEAAKRAALARMAMKQD